MLPVSPAPIPASTRSPNSTASIAVEPDTATGPTARISGVDQLTPVAPRSEPSSPRQGDVGHGQHGLERAQDPEDGDGDREPGADAEPLDPPVGLGEQHQDRGGGDQGDEQGQDADEPVGPRGDEQDHAEEDEQPAAQHYDDRLPQARPEQCADAVAE